MPLGKTDTVKSCKMTHQTNTPEGQLWGILFPLRRDQTEASCHLCHYPTIWWCNGRSHHPWQWQKQTQSHHAINSPPFRCRIGYDNKTSIAYLVDNSKGCMFLSDMHNQMTLHPDGSEPKVRFRLYIFAKSTSAQNHNHTTSQDSFQQQDVWDCCSSVTRHHRSAAW